MAVALYDRSASDTDFANKYHALLQDGFDASPETMLEKLGIRLTDPLLVQSAARLFTKKTNELEALYVSE